MTYILVVFQILAIGPGATHYYGWQYLGEYNSKEACVIASTQLIEKSKDIKYGDSGVLRYDCLRKYNS